MNNYNEEQKILFENYLNKVLLYPQMTKNGINIVEESLEFIVRTQCDQKCEYCYIAKYGDQLYPHHADKETLLNNIKLVLNYFSERKAFFPRFEIFGGEIFADNLIFEIFDILEEYYLKYYNIFGETFFKNYVNTEIIIPNNLSWVLKYPEKKEIFLNYRSRFIEKYNASIGLSWSTDGLYAVDTRERNSMTQEQFDEIFEFASIAGCGCHPMVSSSNIKAWTHGNFKWWKEQYKKWFSDKNDPAFYYLPSMLEVRNDDWTEESLKEYEEFLKLVFEDRKQLCNNDTVALTKHLFNRIEEGEVIHPHLDTIDPIQIHMVDDPNYLDRNADKVTCSFSTCIHINCNNLSLACCHRLTYDMLTPIYFITNDEKTKIIDYKINNIDNFIVLNSMKITAEPVCNNCIYNYICLHGCFGAQFEDAVDILLPCNSVCKMFDVKYRTLFKLYHENGIWKEVFERNYFNDPILSILIRILSKLGYTEYE